MNDVLVIIDIQNEYFEDGALPLDGAAAASIKALELLSFFRTRRRPVVHVRHLSAREGATVFVPGMAGAEIHPRVAPVEGEAVIEKHFPNSFRQSLLMETLRDLSAQRLVVCGMMTHMCVDSTVRAAFDLGHEVVLIPEATATRNLVYDGAEVPAAMVQRSFLAGLNGTFARLMPVAEYVQSVD